MTNIELDTSSTNVQTIALVLLLVVFSIYVAIHVNDFYVPDSDFFDFREKAIQIHNFEWPENFKRPPLYSALVALVSTPIPGKNRELYAAEILSALSALLSLLLVYRISKQFLGKYGFFIAWIWALHPTTLRMAIKPKSEILVMILILWAFDRFLRGDKRAYFLGFLATLVRYDGALAILAFGLADLLFDKHKVKLLVYAVISGSFIIIWTLSQTGGTEGSSYGNYLIDYKPNIIFIKNLWQSALGFLPIHLVKVWAALGIVLMTIGIIYSYSKNRKRCIAIVTFLLGFIAMYIVWPFYNIDSFGVILWNVILLISIGFVSTLNYSNKRLSFMKSYIHNRLATKAWIAGTIVIFCLILIIYFNLIFPYPQYNVQWWILAGFLITLTFYLWWFFSSNSRSRVSLTSLVLSIFLILGFYLNSKSNAEFFDVRYSKAEFRVVGEWYEANHQKNDRMVVVQPTVVAYFTTLDQEKDFIRLSDLPQTPPDELVDWLKSQNATYVAWLSHSKTLENGDAWYNWKRDNRGWNTINFLENGQDTNGFKVVKSIRCGPRWAYIYKIQYSS